MFDFTGHSINDCIVLNDPLEARHDVAAWSIVRGFGPGESPGSRAHSIRTAARSAQSTQMTTTTHIIISHKIQDFNDPEKVLVYNRIEIFQKAVSKQKRSARRSRISLNYWQLSFRAKEKSIIKPRAERYPMTITAHVGLPTR